MELVFVRHGQPAWSEGGTAQLDPRLTDLGLRQAELAAERLAGDRRPVAEILVSPAQRSQETAAPLAAASGVVPQTIPDLVEMKMPDWTDAPVAQVERIFREARDRPPDQWWDGLTGGESFREFHDRITRAMADLLADRSVVPDPEAPHVWRAGTDPRRIVIVAHAGTNAVALGFLLGLDPTPWEWERFVLGHASLARVRAIPLAGGHVFSLRSFNDVEHLPGDLRSR